MSKRDCRKIGKSAKIFLIAFIILSSVALGGLIWDIYNHYNYKIIGEETANELCQKITGNDGAIARDYWDYTTYNKRIENGQIVCVTLSNDSTQNIIIIMENGK